MILEAYDRAIEFFFDLIMLQTKQNLCLYHHFAPAGFSKCNYLLIMKVQKFVGRLQRCLEVFWFFKPVAL